ncbi:phosphotransferase family protein [Paenibacillus piri]|uniref:Aminoglycoside phosphotransferase family protein n=1 Tax=Paenibacillus piri TaxID=2547395 RepID=A0A4R5KBU7_9BACL|nr:aminoglycoside phosphotransferase family protein [Paenibacillus piri]TDF92372.1 aminoglycoside phosphotransferase family protein [Paenibacillus piri]
MDYRKPDIGLTEAMSLLDRYWGRQTDHVTAVSGGNLSSVFFFDSEGKGFVLRVSAIPDAFKRDRCISELLTSQGVPYPRCYKEDTAGPFVFSISDRIEGGVLADLPEAQKNELVPELVGLITRMNQVELGPTSGFGWIGPAGDGTYVSWEAYLHDFYKEDQKGNFWENWHELFRSGFLERDVFEECRARLLHYAPYNAPHRYFVHNDCHAWNLITDGRSLTGIIDGNCLYGDFVIDISIAEGAIPGKDAIQAFQDHYERMGIGIPDFKERLLGARYYKGLDGLRFYAKTGRKSSYDSLRSFLLSLTG